METHTDSDLADLARRFSACTLPKEAWTHHAHLAVGLWHVDRYGAEEALARLRTGIRRLNDSHGTVNSATSGYHETVTRAYVQLLSAFSDRYVDRPLAERLDWLLDGALADKTMLSAFYAPQALTSAEARLG